MTKPIRHEVDGITGVTVEIELTDEEIAERAAEEAALVALESSRIAELEATKAAVLNKLGLTEEELKAVLG